MCVCVCVCVCVCMRGAQVDDILLHLERIERDTAGASEGYRVLLDKFPRSLPLLHSCASFYDAVLNRPLSRSLSLFLSSPLSL